MNARTCIALTLLVAAPTTYYLSSNLRAQENSPPSASTQPARGSQAVPANLSAAMRSMGRAFRALKADAIDSAKSEAALRDIDLLQRDSAISKAGVPPVINGLTGEQKAKQLMAYRAQMADMMRTLLDLEDAVINKKPDDIKKLLAKLDEALDKGHKDFLPAQ